MPGDLESRAAIPTGAAMAVTLKGALPSNCNSEYKQIEVTWDGKN